MLSLIIDTSLENNSITLAKDQDLLQTKIIPPNAQQSRFLIPKLLELLKEFELKLRDLDLLAAAQGPGTFTGTRSGVVVAKTLSFAINIPLVSFCSMQPFVPNPYQGEFQVIFDAKAGGLYVLQGRKKQGQVCLDKPKFMSLEDFVKNTSENGLIVSPHAQLLRSRIGLDIKTADYSHQYIISFINEKYQKGQYISPLAFNAVYLRNP